jgi:hypothetical protein
VTDDLRSEDEQQHLDLTWWQRSALSAVGGAGAIFGTLAIFKTEVEAGPVALLVSGGLFLLLGVSGRLPDRLKVGDNEVIMTRRKQHKADQAVAAVVDAVPPARREEVLNQLGDIGGAARSVDSARRAIGFVNQVLLNLDAAVHQLAAGNFQILDRPENDIGYHFDRGYVIEGRRTLLVEVPLGQVEATWIQMMVRRLARSPWPEGRILVLTQEFPDAELLNLRAQHFDQLYVHTILTADDATPHGLAAIVDQITRKG